MHHLLKIIIYNLQEITYENGVFIVSKKIKLKCFRCHSTVHCHKQSLRDGISCSLCEGQMKTIGPVHTNEINKNALEQAIGTLRNIEYGKIEGVGIETNTYKNGKQYLVINVDFK